MPDCDYCGESFDGEDAYLNHLADEHMGELGPIDRRKVEEHGGGTDDLLSSIPTGPLALVFVIGVSIALIVYVTFFFGSGSGSTNVDASGIEAQPLPDQGDDALLQGVEQFPSQGRDHVERGTDVNYSTMPPTSGPHYTGTVGAGFYEQRQSLGDLVHTLEHGAVVVYYDPAALTPEAEQSLKEWASVHTGTWKSVVVVPHPEENPDAPYVLTAWRHMLEMDQYDPETVQAFLAEYLGRGPENPVR